MVKKLSSLLFIWIFLSIHTVFLLYLLSPSLYDSQYTHTLPHIADTNTIITTTATNIEKPPFPSLVVIGPPKCGTTTLTLTIGDMDDWIRNPNGENHYWNGYNGPLKCFPEWNVPMWTQFFDQWLSNNISFTFYISAAIISKGYQCQMGGYIDHIETSCNYFNTSCDDGKYFFIEAGQTYHRNPFVAIQYGLYLKQTKLIQSLRDPIDMIWSFTWHFQQFIDSDSRNMTMERFIFDRFTKDSPHGYGKYFAELSSYCTKIRNNITNQQYRKEMMVLYLKFKFVYQIVEPEIRQDGFVWIANYLSGFLFYLHILDEIHHNTKWDQFKVIQFEWFYNNADNTGYGLQMIRNWVMKDYMDEKKYPNIARSEFSVAKNKTKKNMHKANGKYSDEFRHKMMPLFSDCNHALKNIIFQQRSHMLIGEWLDWGY